MAKEWILNIATNRWGLNKKILVGPVAQWIRECSPKTLEEWKDCYYEKLTNMLKEKGINLTPSEYLEDLGRKLYIKITEVIQSEIQEVNIEDCIEYIKKLVINRTFEGYKTEVETIYKQLEKSLGVIIKPAPDDWDRLYNVDFYIQIGNKYIGLQIKPISYKQTPEVHKWKEWLERTHERFEKDKGGKVFVVFSIEEGNKKRIYNSEVIKEIQEEIARLKQLVDQWS